MAGGVAMASAVNQRGIMQHYPLVTVVGGSGFVGRHVVKALATAGYRIRVLVRDTIAAEHLKTCATVGQIAIEHADITRPETLSGKFSGSMAVVNLVSILYESGRQKFDRINIEGARAVALPQSKEVIHTIARQWTVDGQNGVQHPLGMSAYRLEVDAHIVTGSSTAINNLVQCVVAHGIDIDELVLEPLASNESVLRPEERHMGALFRSQHRFVASQWF